jgi:hypothetical protein
MTLADLDPDLIEQLKTLPVQRPFPEVEVVVIPTRPMIRLCAILMRCLGVLKSDIARVKVISLEQEAAAGMVSIYQGPEHLTEGPDGAATVPRSSYLLIETEVTRGALNRLSGTMIVGTGDSRELAYLFAQGLVKALAARRLSAHPDAVVLEEEYGEPPQGPQ